MLIKLIPFGVVCDVITLYILEPLHPCYFVTTYAGRKGNLTSSRPYNQSKQQ